MRKVAAAALALPVILVVYVLSLVRRSARLVPTRPLPRLGLLAGILVAVGVLAWTQARPTAITAHPPSTPAPVPAAAFRGEIRAGTSPSAVVTMTFPGPMSAASVASGLEVEPAAPVSLAWDATGTVLSVTPVGRWTPGIYHTITVPAGTLMASGEPLLTATRASFLTRDATTAAIAATEGSKGKAAPTTAFVVSFDHAIVRSTLGLAIEPAVAGRFIVDADAPTSAPVFLFEPAAPLAPGTSYRVSLAPGVVDGDGLAVAAQPLTVVTAAAPNLVRFRPVDRSTAIDIKQALSVRFSEPMDRAATTAAWIATQNGTAIDGTFAWAEGDTVLQFSPKAPLGYSQTIVMSIGAGARSAAGVPIAAAASASFTTAAKPVPRTTTPPPPPSGGGGGGAGGGTWTAVEAYYLTLMNCTRTGGWVSSTGSCSGAGSRAVAPLWQDMGISANVTRPYAKKLVIDNVCSHFYGTTPAQRLTAAGYTSYIWAENIGCGGGDPYKAMLADHLFFQGEASTNGGHYRNLMDAKFDRCGIGVWAYAGRVRLVVDFYHPL